MHIPDQPLLELEFKAIRKYEEDAIEFNITNNPYHYELAEEMAALYRKFFAILTSSQAPKEVGIEEPTPFMMGCGAYYDLGMITLLRSHVSDSYFYTRKAIELVVFAKEVNKSPEKMGIWEKAAEDEVSYKTYRRQFRNDTLFSPFPELYKKYNIASRLAHSSKYSLAPHFDIGGDEHHTTFTWDIFSQEVSIGNHILNTIETHIQLIEILEDIFKTRLEHDLANWEGQKKILIGRLEGLRTRTILGTKDLNPTPVSPWGQHP